MELHSENYSSDLLQSLNSQQEGGTLSDVILHCYPAPSHHTTTHRLRIPCQSSTSHASSVSAGHAPVTVCQSSTSHASSVSASHAPVTVYQSYNNPTSHIPLATPLLAGQAQGSGSESGLIFDRDCSGSSELSHEITCSGCQSIDISHAHSHPVPAHRCVLAANSSYFHALFYSTFADSTSRDYLIPCSSVEVLTKAVRFMYSGDVTITDDVMGEDLLRLADFLGASRLVNICVTYFQTRISVETCLKVKDIAVTYSLEALNRDVMNFMLDRWPVLIRRTDIVEVGKETLRQLISVEGETNYAREADILSAICRWAESRDVITCYHCSSKNAKPCSPVCRPSTTTESPSKQETESPGQQECSHACRAEQQIPSSEECEAGTQSSGCCSSERSGCEEHYVEQSISDVTSPEKESRESRQQCVHHRNQTKRQRYHSSSSDYDLLDCVEFDYLDVRSLKRDVLGRSRVREWLRERQPERLRDIERRVERYEQTTRRDYCDVLLVRSRKSSRRHLSGRNKRTEVIRGNTKHRGVTTCREIIESDGRKTREVVSYRTVTLRDNVTDTGLVRAGLESPVPAGCEAVERRESGGESGGEGCSGVQLMVYDPERDEWRLMEERGVVEPRTVRGERLEGLESMVRLGGHVYLLCSRDEDLCGSLHSPRQSKHLISLNVTELRLQGAEPQAGSAVGAEYSEAESLAYMKAPSRYVHTASEEAWSGEWEGLPSPQRVQGQTHLIATTSELLVVDRHGTVERFNPVDEHEWMVVVTRGFSHQAVAAVTLCVLPLATDRTLYLLRTVTSGHSFSYSQKCFQLYRLDTHSYGATWQPITEQIEAAELFTEEPSENLEDFDFHGISISPGLVTLSDVLGYPRAQVFLGTGEWKSLPQVFPPPSYFKLDRSVWGGVGVGGRVYCVREGGERGEGGECIELWMYDVIKRRYKLIKQPPLCPTAVMCAISLPKQLLYALTRHSCCGHL